MDEVDEFLAHYGVKGMHWGKRKEQSPADRLKKLEKKRDKFNGEKILRGAELKGWAIRKGAKNPTAAAYRGVALRGAAEVAIILAGSNIALNQMNAHSSTIRNGKIAFGALAATAAKVRVDELRSIHQFEAHRKIIDEIADIQKQQKKASK